MSNLKNLTKNNTKDEILAAYGEAKKMLETFQSQVVDPKNAAQAAKNQTTLNNVASLAAVDVATAITQLQKEIGSSLSQVSLKVSEQLNNYTNLEDAIALKKQEIKELYDIEKEANTLTALINANKQTVMDFEKSFADRKAVAEQELKDLQDKLLQEREDHVTQLNKTHKETMDGFTKKEAEWNYDFERRKKTENDTWEDEKAIREKELAEKEEVVEKKFTEIIGKEQAIKELEEKVKQIPTLVQEAKEEGMKEGKAAAEKSHVFETRAIKSSYESEIAILENKVKLLEGTITKQDLEITTLKADLKDAYGKVQETATSAVNAQANANARMVSGIEAISKDSATRGQK